MIANTLGRPVLSVKRRASKTLFATDVVVTHLGGATMPAGSKESLLRYNRDLKTFVAEWVETGRLARIEERVWSQYPALRELTEIGARINRVGETWDSDAAAFGRELDELIDLIRPYELFRGLLQQRVRLHLDLCREKGDDLNARVCEGALARLKGTPWINPGVNLVWLEFYNGYDLVEWEERVHAVPVSLDYRIVSYRVYTPEEQRGLSEVISGESVEAVRGLVDRAVKEKGVTPGGALRRFQWQLVKFDKWALKPRAGGLHGLAAWGYREIARRVAVGGYRRVKGAAR